MAERLRRWSPVGLVALTLLLAGVAAAGPGMTGGTLPPREEDPLGPPSPAPTASAPQAPPRGADEFVQTDYPAWITWPVTALILALAAGTVLLLLYAGVRTLLTERVLRKPVTDQPASQPGGKLTAEQLRRAVRAGLADIDAGGDPRRAVIACWLRLERIAAAAGTARLAADTPADLVSRLLAAHRVSNDALARLADAYRRARYAPDEVGDELVATARQALSDVAGELGSADALRQASR